MDYLEERTVGPSLGADSIHDGLLAGVVGVGVVILVMLVYYKRAGVNATLALILNAVILLAALAFLGVVVLHLGLHLIVLGVGGLAFRVLQLALTQSLYTGIVWATKIITDPFHDIKLYHRAPLHLLRGEWMEPGHKR